MILSSIRRCDKHRDRRRLTERGTPSLKKLLSIVLAITLALLLLTNAAAARTAQIPAEVIYEQNADAVFMLETFNEFGRSIRTASGFFISEDGLAVTCLHVFEDAESATVTLSNGDSYEILGINAKSEEFNIAIFSLDADKTGWNFLSLADSDLIEPGNTVYVIGSPFGYVNTMSAGIISCKEREVAGEKLIQFTAPISFGSGGSPLLDARGRVIGINSISFSYGQNLNLAVKINHVRSMQPGECVPLPVQTSDQDD